MLAQVNMDLPRVGDGAAAIFLDHNKHLHGDNQQHCHCDNDQHGDNPGVQVRS